jgi:hypothetical protein
MPVPIMADAEQAREHAGRAEALAEKERAAAERLRRAERA